MSETEHSTLSQASTLVYRHAQAGIAASGQCWTFDRKELHTWNTTEISQLPLFGHLPYPVSTQVSVSVSQYQVLIRAAPPFLECCSISTLVCRMALVRLQ